MTKLMCNLNSLEFISDYQSIGLSGLMVGNDEISSRHILNLGVETMIELSKQFEVYVLMNQLYSEQEFEVVRKWLLMIKDTMIQGIIFQDFGLFQLAKSLGLKQKMMYHPETLNTNHQTLTDLHDLGIDEAFIARELSKEHMIQIIEKSTMPLMMQIHGVEYMGQSKRPLISNYNNHIQGHLHQGPYTLKVKDSQIEAYIYEDQYGCHVQTKEEMCALNLLESFKKAQWFFIETRYMDEYRALEMVNLYQDAVDALNNDTFLRDVHVLRPLMNKLMNGHIHTGFMEDGTVYRLEDVREKDNEKRN